MDITACHIQSLSRFKTVSELEEGKIYIVFGKEESYGEYGCCLLKMRDENGNYFLLYPGFSLNDFVHCEFDLKAAFKFTLKEFMGVKIPFTENVNNIDAVVMGELIRNNAK